MSEAIINPGSGPVADATDVKAIIAVQQFVADIAGIPSRRHDEPLPGVTFERCPKHDSRGRFGFILKLGERECIVEMPGIDVERVRYLGSDDQNIWHFPRLYVGGDSWVWMYAVSSARDALSGANEGEP